MESYVEDKVKKYKVVIDFGNCLSIKITWSEIIRGQKDNWVKPIRIIYDNTCADCGCFFRKAVLVRACQAEFSGVVGRVLVAKNERHLISMCREIIGNRSVFLLPGHDSNDEIKDCEKCKD